MKYGPDKHVKYAQAPPPSPPAATGNSLAVTVNYTGKGVVDAAHEILVVLFGDPEVDVASANTTAHLEDGIRRRLTG